MNHFSNLRTATAALFFLLYTFVAFAQPTVLGTQLANGSYVTYDLNTLGGFKQFRLQASTSAGVSTRNWEFAIGTAGSTNYSTNWRPYTTGNTLSANTFIPTSFDNGARYNTGFGGQSGLLPAITSGNYYTFNVSNNAAADNVMQLLETTFDPVSISTVTQNPAGANVLTTQSPVITVTTASAPAMGENVFVRYTTDAFLSSTLVQLSFTGATGTATLPAQPSGTVVSYYIYSSNKTLVQINSDVTSNGQAAHDMATLNLNNNGGSNYSYTVTSNNILVTSTGGSSMSATYTTLAAAITAINGGTIHTGTIVCTVNDGYTETAPAGGFSITATGTMANPITLRRSNTGGSRPIFTAPTTHTSGVLHDAIFEIIGGDFITIDGFEMRENSANLTTTPGSNNMTEWGVALLYASATNGAQNNTIQNNVITLNRTYQNTFGIYSNSTHSATAPTTSATATTAAGGNSGLKIYGNSITNVNQGIVVVGPTAAADMNTGLDIGGTGGALSNTITNWGTTGTFSGYANVSGTLNGILIRNSIGFNVSFNTLTSSEGGNTVTAAQRAIFVPSFSNAPTGTFTNNINNNIISVQSGIASGTVNGIIVENTTNTVTGTLNMNSNDFTTMNHTVVGTGAINMLSSAMACLHTSISSNTFTNLTTNTTGNVNFIVNAISVPTSGGTQAISNNSIVTAFNKTGAGGTITFFTSNASSVTGSIINFQNNNLSNITATGATGFVGINNTDGGSPTKTFTGNTFNNINGGSGTMNPMTVNFFGGSTSSVSSNTITNISWGAAVTALTIGGSSSATTLNVNSNIINNISSTAGAVIGISNTTPSTTLNMSSNTVNTLSSTSVGTNIGISYGGTAPTANIFKNKIYDISGNNTGTIVNGIAISSGGANTNISNNLIGDLRATAATITAPASAIIGINLTSTATTSNLNVYYNTIYLNATSSGTNFGTSGIFHTASATATTAAINLRNNNIVNTSVANGTGLSVAYRRSSTNLNNYNAASNNNNFFGTSGLFTNGTTTNTTLTAYKTLMSTRDQASINENPTWQSTSGSSADFLKYDIGVASGIESGGAGIGTSPFPAPFNDDYTGTIRFGSTGTTSTGTAPDMGAWELQGTPLPLCMGTPSASTINGVASVCIGSGTNLTLSTTYTDLGITYQWKSGTAPGGPYTNLGTSPSQATGNLSADTYYICEITCTNSGITYTTAEKSVLVNALPSVTVTPSAASYCTPGGTAVSITATGGTTYAWGPATGLNVTNVATVLASPATSTTYIVTVTDANLCVNTGTVVITVGNSVTSNATATPVSICTGANSQLNVFAGQPFTTPAAATYAFAGLSGTYATLTGTTSPAPTVLTGSTILGDDVGVGNLPIGFTFNYNGTPETVFGISSNGFIQLGNTSATFTGFSSNALASTAKVIAPFWDDNNTTATTVQYRTAGTAPNRTLTVEWAGIKIGGSGGGTHTLNMQAILYEATGVVQIVYGSSTVGTGAITATIGISGASGNYRSVTPLSPSNTSTSSTSSENNTIAAFTNIPTGTTYTFTPTGAPSFTYSWSPPTFLSATNIANPIATAVTSTTSYTVTVTGNAGCSATATTTVTVDPLTCAPATFSATRCAGSNFTVTANISGGGAPFTYVWSDGTNSYPNAPTITANLPAGTYNFTCLITDACGGSCNSDVTVVVNDLPTIAITPTPANALICGTGSVSMTASGASTYAWTPTTFLTPSNGLSATVVSAATITTAYTATGTDANGCANTAIQTVTVAPAVTSPTALAAPNPICEGSTLNLSSSAVTSGYTMDGNSSVAFIDISTTGTSVGTIADDSEHNITIPSFNYNGVAYTSARVGNNGALVFGTTTGDIIYTNSALPQGIAASASASSGLITGSGNSLAAICANWDDLTPGTGGSIRTQTIGNKYIVQWTNEDNFGATGSGTITFQIQLDLINGQIHLVYPDITYGAAGFDGGQSATVGLNYSAASAIQYSFNTVSLVDGQSITFTPTALMYAWTGPNSFTSSVQNPAISSITSAASGVYTVTATSPAGCTAQASTSIVTVNPNYTITATSGTGGNVTPSGVTTLSCEGTGDQTYMITPDACYSIEDVLVNGVSVGAVSTYTFTDVTSNQTIAATFTLNGPYTLTYTAGSGGSISGTTPQTVTCGASGSAVTAVADACYSFVNWSDGNTNATRTDMNVQSNINVTANFLLNTYTITVTAGANGSITPTTGTVNCGSNATYIITPDMGYVIADVLVDGNSVGAVASYTFSNVTSNHTISATFILDCPTPSISDVNPIPFNRAGGQSLTISGTNFSTTGNTVTIGGNVVMVNSESATSITITTPPNLCNGNITVTNACGNVSNSFAYTVQDPFIADVNPSVFMEGISITINGNNFGSSANSVTIGGIAMTTLTFQSNTQIVGIVPAGIPCSGNVVVTICGQSSNGVAYTVPAPSISGVNPATLSRAGGQSLVISGSNFSGTGNTVTIGGNPVLVNSESATSITITTPPNLCSGNIAVTNTCGQISNTYAYTVTDPFIAGINPTVLTTGSTISITGSNFASSGNVVTIGGVNMTSFISQDHTVIIGTVPSGVPCSGNVVVNICGENSNGVAYTLQSPSVPLITATESTCQSGCTVSGGSFTATTACGAGTTLTYYSDNSGSNPTTTAPTYNQTTPMTIYYACVDDVTGCRSAIQTLTTVPGSCTTPAIPMVDATAATCSSAGTATISNYDMNNTYTFDPVGPTAGLGGVINNIMTGTNYTVVATNNSGCSSAASSSFSVDAQLAIPFAPLAGSNSPVCLGATLALTSSASGTMPFTYSWEGPNMFASTDQNPDIAGFTSLASGTYTVTVSLICAAALIRVW